MGRLAAERALRVRRGRAARQRQAEIGGLGCGAQAQRRVGGDVGVASERDLVAERDQAGPEWPRGGGRGATQPALSLR